MVKKYILVCCLVLILSFACTAAAYTPAACFFGNAKYLLYIHKISYRLDVYERNKDGVVYSFPIAVAKNPGDKQRTGDNRTPTSWGSAVAIPAKYTGASSGIPSSQVPFRIEDVCPAHDWTHDFGDGKGVIAGAYGPWFLSLDTGWIGIGIHGTHDANSIGTMASEGCIRLRNEDIQRLKDIVCSDNGGIGTGVIITEDWVKQKKRRLRVILQNVAFLFCFRFSMLL